MTAGHIERLGRLEAIADAAEALDAAARAFRASGYSDATLQAARAAEAALIRAMRDAGKAAVRVRGQLYVDVYAHHVADPDGDGLWSVAVVPPEAVLA